MSPLFIVGLIAVVLVLLVAYAFVYQTIENKRKQKQRLLTALKVRSKNFDQMLGGFPQGFLTKDLQILLHKCMLDTEEQLAKLEPKDSSHIASIEQARAAIVQLQNNPGSHSRQKIENPAQIKLLRTYLQELLKFVIKLKNKGMVSAKQAATCEQQARDLMVQVTVEGYTTQAEVAQTEGKTRLAAHYYGLAQKLLGKENTRQQYSQLIGQITTKIQLLEQKLAEEAATTATSVEDNGKPWDRFENDDDLWKKKTVYD